jgi:NTE family protein
MSQPSVGIALGSGAARGWAHIGILKALNALNIRPSIVCGSSMGALIGASYCLGKLDPMEDWAKSLTRTGIIKFLDVKAFRSAGLLQGRRLMKFLDETLGEQPIEDLDRRFACVATDIETGREIWLQSGPILEQVRASIALPGLLAAHPLENRWLVDGGLVNPVPVSLCRAMGAEVVIAVDVNGDLLKRSHLQKPQPSITERAMNRLGLDRHHMIQQLLNSDGSQPPSAFEIMINSFNIVQERITRSRLAGEPPDILLSPKLNTIGLLEFERAGEAIAAGKRCVELAKHSIQDCISETSL